MTIGLIILAAAMHWYQIVKIRMLKENNQRQVLDIGGTVFQFIRRDLNACGYKGCRTNDQNYPLRRHFGDIGNPHQYLRTDRAVFGFSAETGVCQQYIPPQFCHHIKTDSDVLIIYNIPQKILTLKESMLEPEDALQVAQAKQIKENAMVLISDAHQGDVFIASAVENDKIKHQLGGNLNDTLNLSKSYRQGAEITELQTVVYYIGISERPTADSRSYALFRSDIRKKPREIVTGIVDFSVEYGFWDPAHESHPGFQYYQASLIKPEQWAFVRMVRLKIETKGEVYHGVSQKNRHWEYAFAIRNGHRINVGSGST